MELSKNESVEKILKTILSCTTVDQVMTTSGWVERLFEQGQITISQTQTFLQLLQLQLDKIEVEYEKEMKNNL